MTSLSAPSPVLSVSLFDLLRDEFGDTLPLMRCTKATLVHLSHTLEDLVLKDHIPALLFTGFQESSHWREETERYRALAAVAQQVCIFAGGTLPPESDARQLHVTLSGDDPLRQEWFLVLLCPEFAVLLCGKDRQVPAAEEATRQFDTIWSFEPAILERVLDLLEQVIGQYRPERLTSLRDARRAYPLVEPKASIITALTTELIRFEEELHQSLHATTTRLDDQLRWRDDLTATLVHDLRSPLQSLILSLNMAERNTPNNADSLQHLVQVATRSARTLNDMVQLILDTNQLAAGQVAVTWSPLQPDDLIAEATAPLHMLLDANQLALHIEFDPHVALIWGDESLLRRVLQNLVGNAIKFSPPNNTIVVGLSMAPDGKQIELRVRDNGQGIAPSAINHVFDRYYKVDGQDRRGNGLGLYFCRLATEAHGGTIRAASQIGVGTTITVVLPKTPPPTGFLF